MRMGGYNATRSDCVLSFSFSFVFLFLCNVLGQEGVLCFQSKTRLDYFI